MPRKLVGIQEAAAHLGVAAQTLRRWEREGRLMPDARTLGGRRRYDLSRLRPEQFRTAAGRVTVAYARVSNAVPVAGAGSALVQQQQALVAYCSRQAAPFEVIADIGSSMNVQRPGLRRLLDAIVAGRVGQLVVTHRDRLLRFGAELVFAVCEAKGVEVVILNQDADALAEEELAADVSEMIAVFGARLYGGRSPNGHALLDDMRRAVDGFREAASARGGPVDGESIVSRSETGRNGQE